MDGYDNYVVDAADPFAGMTTGSATLNPGAFVRAGGPRGLATNYVELNPAYGGTEAPMHTVPYTFMPGVKPSLSVWFALRVRAGSRFSLVLSPRASSRGVWRYYLLHNIPESGQMVVLNPANTNRLFETPHNLLTPDVWHTVFYTSAPGTRHTLVIDNISFTIPDIHSSLPNLPAHCYLSFLGDIAEIVTPSKIDISATVVTSGGCDWTYAHPGTMFNVSAQAPSVIQGPQPGQAEMWPNTGGIPPWEVFKRKGFSGTDPAFWKPDNEYQYIRWLYAQFPTEVLRNKIMAYQIQTQADTLYTNRPINYYDPRDGALLHSFPPGTFNYHVVAKGFSEALAVKQGHVNYPGIVVAS